MADYKVLAEKYWLHARVSPRGVVSFYPASVARAMRKGETDSPLSIKPNFTGGHEPFFLTPIGDGRWGAGGVDVSKPQGKKGGIRAGWGVLGRSRGVSRKTLRQILEIAAAMELEYGRDGLRFCTLTLPASTEQAFRVLAEWSSWVVDVFSKRLARLLGKGHGRLWVWEYQKRGALHAHLVVGAASGVDRVTTAKIKKMWVEVLRGLSEKTGVDLFRKNASFSWKNDPSKVRADSQKVRKSVAAYLGKYLSKSASKIGGGKNRFYPVARWSSWNREARSSMRKHTHTAVLGCVEWDVWESLKGGLSAFMESIKAEGTKIIDSAKNGGMRDALYCIHASQKDCIHAFKELIQEAKSLLPQSHMEWQSGEKRDVISYYESLKNQQLWWEREQRKHDDRLSLYSQTGRKAPMSPGWVRPNYVDVGEWGADNCSQRVEIVDERGRLKNIYKGESLRDYELRGLWQAWESGILRLS